uniref:Uncharacterized protein n=1 Tax=Oryza sativa subsp. japonica TaxID=39947 RepID=Q7F0R2_ORYSJ|nr:hypothetical protein [Oryza sativa Japonica Group]BAD30443.1 hypothetical protein [Oryza sativa Japonica Group]
MVWMLVAHSRVYYFAQGQAEHANGGEAAAELATATGAARASDVCALLHGRDQAQQIEWRIDSALRG